MQEKPKENESPMDERQDVCDDSEWSEDQKNRGYYYDDAHGYEVFDPEKEDEDDTE